MFDLMFTIVPVLVIGMFIYVIVSGIGSWHKNNNSPRLSVPVKIVTKRADTMYTPRGYDVIITYNLLRDF